MGWGLSGADSELEESSETNNGTGALDFRRRL